jgi:hypothetical protein
MGHTPDREMRSPNFKVADKKLTNEEFNREWTNLGLLNDGSNQVCETSAMPPASPKLRNIATTRSEASGA